jgi:hypothetical protein
LKFESCPRTADLIASFVRRLSSEDLLVAAIADALRGKAPHLVSAALIAI